MGSSEQSLHLPQQIVEEILPWLPVKSLVRFRCVSKPWRSLIGSKQFIKTQIQKNSTKNTRVVQIGLQQYSLHTLLNEPSIDPSFLTDDPTIIRSDIVGCCNGLLCLYICSIICHRDTDRFLVWNPATRISFELPGTWPGIQPCGFGYDAASGAYKLFGVLYEGREIKGMVYSSKTNSWRTILYGLDCYPMLENGSSKFVGGKIHWLSDAAIAWFDLKSEVLGVIKYPCGVWNGFRPLKWLGEIKGCLCLVSDYNNRRELGVWVMKESWLKLLNVPFDFPDSDCSLDHRSFLGLFEIVSEGVVLVICGSDFVALNRDDAVLCSPKKFTGCFEMWATWKDIFRRSYWNTHFYVESLVSPVPEANHSTV